MSTIALWAIVWVAACIAVAALFSISKEMDRVFVWKDAVATELCRQFNVDYRVAFNMVDATFDTKTVIYKTHLLGSVQVIAMRLFWRKADEFGWMPHHFIGRALPEALYKHHSWGGIIVEA